MLRSGPVTVNCALKALKEAWHWSLQLLDAQVGLFCKRDIVYCSYTCMCSINTCTYRHATYGSDVLVYHSDSYIVYIAADILHLSIYINLLCTVL